MSAGDDANRNNDTILVFDVDGTLTRARQDVSAEMWQLLKRAAAKYPLAIVSGSDFNKIVEQLGGDVEELLTTFDYVFVENGLCGYHGREPLPDQSISDAVGERKLQELINFCLHYMSTIELPVKRGTFIEFRKGMLNVSPIGRSCMQAERDAFVEFEKNEPIRQRFVDALRERFADDGLTFSIGGQISIDVFPDGWNKTFCLRYLTPKYKHIYFFGDKTHPGGNDHEIFSHPATIGHSVENPEHTGELLEQKFL